MRYRNDEAGLKNVVFMSRRVALSSSCVYVRHSSADDSGPFASRFCPIRHGSADNKSVRGDQFAQVMRLY